VRRSSTRKGDVAADEAVYGAIRRALHRGRLTPGTRLQEPALARVLKVSRERVRKALHRLVHEGWLAAVPNKGTVVPSLTVEEMRNIYDVRSMLEEGIVRRLSAALSSSGIKRLKAHVLEEKQAIRADDRGRLFRLSGEFHVLLAELCGNDELTRLLRGLLTRATTHFSLAAPRHLNGCAGPHDHGDIVQAILDGKGEKASKLMLSHLAGLIELQSARLPSPPAVDLVEAFGEL
jgi:DNA-binding GntR family transcriptional regulator